MNINLESLRRASLAQSVYLKAALVFFGSRLLILCAIAFAANFVPQTPGVGVWNATDSWYRYLLRWDIGWYSRIAREGYFYDGNDSIEQPVVFFPLHPLFAGFVARILRVSAPLALLIVSNLAILIAVFFFVKLVKDAYDERTALISLALLCFFPTSFFFSAGYTESLALALVVGFFLALQKEQFLLAAMCAAFALATRSTSIVLLPPLWWELWRKYRTDKQQFVWKTSALTVIATSGLWLYMLYLWRAFGHPFAFATAQRAWLGSESLASQLHKTLTLQPFAHLADIWHNGLTVANLNSWFFVVFVLIALILCRRLNLSMFFYTAMTLGLLYVSRSASKAEFQSFNRYLLLVFPVFILAADQLKKRPRLCLSIVALLAVMLSVFTAMYAQWYWVG